jgi:hypothetical protein
MTFHLEGWALLGLVVGVLLPGIVGLVTKAVTNATYKSLLLVALSAISGFGSQAIAAHEAGTSYDAGQGLLTALGAFVIGVSTHFGVMIPTGLKDKLQAVGSGDAGLGSIRLMLLVSVVVFAVLAVIARTGPAFVVCLGIAAGLTLLFLRVHRQEQLRERIRA